MKRICKMGLLAIALSVGLSYHSNAQEKKKSGVEKAATDVGNKTAEVAVKGASKVTDKVWKGKMAPDGSDVYINNKNEKYYVNKKGAKIWLKPSQIKDRPKD
ncbi:hypothetical protein [Pedobacter sp. MW01-1-1]|uniref:hypothetical protein n=1 Tax=Pedobacter sp. MW01-1-1 TaxID=3383027 RepID=UPI003FF10621